MTLPIAEAPSYATPKHPCIGVQPISRGWHTFFLPWRHDGRVVWWGEPCDSRSEALEQAQQLCARHA